MNWIYSIENKIFTLVGYRVKEALSLKYPDITFTRDPQPDGNMNHFPTIYMNFLSEEEGHTLDNEESGIASTINIEVTANKTQGSNGARTVAYEVLDKLHNIGYNATSPVKVVPTGNDTSQYVFTVYRMIGSSTKIG